MKVRLVRPQRRFDRLAQSIGIGRRLPLCEQTVARIGVVDLHRRKPQPRVRPAAADALEHPHLHTTPRGQRLVAHVLEAGAEVDALGVTEVGMGAVEQYAGHGGVGVEGAESYIAPRATRTPRPSHREIDQLRRAAERIFAADHHDRPQGRRP